MTIDVLVITPSMFVIPLPNSSDYDLNAETAKKVADLYNPLDSRYMLVVLTNFASSGYPRMQVYRVHGKNIQKMLER